MPPWTSVPKQQRGWRGPRPAARCNQHFKVGAQCLGSASARPRGGLQSGTASGLLSGRAGLELGGAGRGQLNPTEGPPVRVPGALAGLCASLSAATAGAHSDGLGGLAGPVRPVALGIHAKSLAKCALGFQAQRRPLYSDFGERLEARLRLGRGAWTSGPRVAVRRPAKPFPACVHSAAALSTQVGHTRPSPRRKKNTGKQGNLGHARERREGQVGTAWRAARSGPRGVRVPAPPTHLPAAPALVGHRSTARTRGSAGGSAQRADTAFWAGRLDLARPDGMGQKAWPKRTSPERPCPKKAWA